jgi:hypothetical protein
MYARVRNRGSGKLNSPDRREDKSTEAGSARPASLDVRSHGHEARFHSHYGCGNELSNTAEDDFRPSRNYTDPPPMASSTRPPGGNPTIWSPPGVDSGDVGRVFRGPPGGAGTRCIIRSPQLMLNSTALRDESVVDASRGSNVKDHG